MTNRMPELLCPAGNLESLEAALHFGADAVYGGMKQFGLRAFAGNFDEEALTQAVEKMHGAGKKWSAQTSTMWKCARPKASSRARSST